MGTLDYQAIATEATTIQGTAWSMQKPRELASLLEYLDGKDIRRALEIGSNYGGTTWALGHVVKGQIVCVDNEVLEGRMERAQGNFVMVKGDSQDLSTRDEVLRQISGFFDFVFIDADHAYSSVWADAKIWYSLLQRDGVIAFHDIYHRKTADIDMWRFWSEWRSGHPSFEIFDPAEAWGGIGVTPPLGDAVTLPPWAHFGMGPQKWSLDE